MNDFTVDGDLVRKLAGLLDETHLTEIEYAWGEHRIRVTRAPAVMHAVAAPAMAAAIPGVAPSVAEAPIADHPGAVTSPMVGTVYLSASPGAAPFVRPGDAISVGQTVLIIEAMKVMNQIRATKSGTVKRILIADGAPVEFGQALMVIE
ncbi:MAG TPA: acetyl-CoA carboxylase biotin carboxyl carrier protein [Stellaceae bacterium]|nr:acetyl-CoA carboxylase biotin carboxyl carrier protein [Stellaceae bacterium]